MLLYDVLTLKKKAMMSRVTETRYDSDTDSEFDYLLDEHESSTNDEAEYIGESLCLTSYV